MKMDWKKENMYGWQPDELPGADLFPLGNMFWVVWMTRVVAN